MKKIDFHIHTVPANGKDANFVFDLTKFQEYTGGLSIDAVAITNHNLFDLDQFKEISATLKNMVDFPGIEIDFEDGHLLLIGENDNLDDLHQKCESIGSEFSSGNKITVEKLKEIFEDLSSYLLVPHYDKNPKVSQGVIDSLKEHIFSGEVTSPKKFHRLVKDGSSLTPVLFSDARISTSLNIEKHQGNQTFVKTSVNPLTLASITAALKDKDKVFLTNSEQHDFFQAFSDGKELSHGFNEMLEKERSAVREEHLSMFRVVVDDIVEIDRRTSHYKLQEYAESLVKFAKSEELQDEFSKAVLFKETPYSIRTDEDLEKVIKAT